MSGANPAGFLQFAVGLGFSGASLARVLRPVEEKHFYFQLSSKHTDVQCRGKNWYSVYILGMKSLVAVICYALHFHPHFCKAWELYNK